VLIIGCGGLLYNALIAARELEEKEKIGAVVLNCSSIKPIDEKKIVELAKKIGAVVTVEEHQVHGGLGGAVAEVLAKYAPTPIEFIGMQDVFGESGAPEELIKKFGMMPKDIVMAAKRAIRRAK
jgi:transketolase